MTEKEFIDKAIEYRKKGEEYAWQFACHEGGFESCYDCPVSYRGGCGCPDVFLDEIIRLREDKPEKVETNLEHYFKRKSDMSDESYAGYLTTTQLTMFCSDTSAMVRFRKSYADNLIEWLLSPYDPHDSPKYQMSQFEYDLLKSYWENHCGSRKTEEFVTLRHMRSLGYLKNVPTDVRIRDALENAEVIEE